MPVFSAPRALTTTDRRESRISLDFNAGRTTPGLKRRSRIQMILSSLGIQISLRFSARDIRTLRFGNRIYGLAQGGIGSSSHRRSRWHDVSRRHRRRPPGGESGPAGCPQFPQPHESGRVGQESRRPHRAPGHGGMRWCHALKIVRLPPTVKRARERVQLRNTHCAQT
jgi:hypothetical protein